jgi:type II secretory pathway predicted ATPase ExeA/TolA-binding protein
MYRSFYNLSKKPFKISSDPRFLWNGEKHQEALANLRYGLLEPNGYVVLTGDVGTGKTTLVNALIESLSDNVLLANINHPTLNTLDFFNLVAKAYDPSTGISTKAEFLLFLKKFLQKSHAQGKVVLLIIDEAHRLSMELLEEIRLLSNMEQVGMHPVNIFFVGQSELKKRLLSPMCRALRQRITLFYDIAPLTAKETQEYIEHRLRVAGTNQQVFTPSAISEIHNFTRGYPRLINILCDRAMLTGFVMGQSKINVTLVMESIKEISLLAPDASMDFSSQIDKLSNWGRPPVTRVESQPQDWENKHPQGLEAPEKKNRGLNNLMDATLQMGSSLVKKNRRRLRSMRVAGLFLLIVVAVGILIYIETPVKHEVSATSEEERVDYQPRISGTQDVQVEPQQSPSVVNEEKVAFEPPKRVTQKLQQDPAEVPGKEKSATEPRPVVAGSPLNQKKLHSESFPSEGQLSIPSQSVEMPAAVLPELPQPTNLDLASRALERKNFQKAIDLLEAERNLHPDSYVTNAESYSKALSGRAQQLSKPSPNKAKALLQKAVEENPKNSNAYFILGRIYSRSKDYAMAIDAYLHAVMWNPNYSDAFFNLGLIYATTGMYEDAEEQFRHVVVLEPAYLDKALFNLAVMQQKLDKKEESLANLQMAVKIRPENQKAQSYLKQLQGTGGIAQK